MDPDDADATPPLDLDLSGSPHDAFSKSIFSEPALAAKLVRKRLPAPIAAAADWTSLELVPASFVKSSLSQVHSDLLFSMRIGGRRCLLYLLFEHQSTVDPAMPLRLLGYLFEILQRHHQQVGLPLPPVIPFVFHQGPDRWNASPAFEDLFELPDEAAADLLAFLPRFRHALLDLSVSDPESEEEDLDLRVILQLMKLARSREMPRFFRWMAAVAAERLPDSLLKRLLVYALHADQDLDVEEIYGHLSANPDLQHQTMSVAEKLKAEGLREGLERGLERGLEKGRQEGRQEGRIEGLIGQIQLLEEILGLDVSPRETLEALDLSKLETRCADLRRDYQARNKGR